MPKEKPLALAKCGLCRAPDEKIAFLWGACFAFRLLEKIQDPGRSKGVEMPFTDRPAAFGILRGTKVRCGCRARKWLNGTKHMCDDGTMLF